MTSLEPARDVSKSPTGDAAAAAPQIINGLTVRPRKQSNLWLCGLLLLPDIAALLLLVGLGMHRLLRYLGTKGKVESYLEEISDVPPRIKT
jgi:hypothetical protein